MLWSDEGDDDDEDGGGGDRGGGGIGGSGGLLLSSSGKVSCRREVSITASIQINWEEEEEEEEEEDDDDALLVAENLCWISLTMDLGLPIKLGILVDDVDVATIGSPPEEAAWETMCTASPSYRYLTFSQCARMRERERENRCWSFIEIHGCGIQIQRKEKKSCGGQCVSNITHRQTSANQVH
jgi:hypothetical protein